MENLFKNSHSQKIKRDQKYKQQRKEQNQQFELIKYKINKYSPVQLLEFMENEYEKLIMAKSYMSSKINNEICKKIISLPNQIKEIQKNKVGKCIRELGIEITDQQLTQSYQNNTFKWLKILHPRLQIGTNWKNNYVIDYNRRTLNPFHKQFLKTNFKENEFYFPLHKRMKKECIQMIKIITTFQEKAREVDEL